MRRLLNLPAAIFIVLIIACVLSLASCASDEDDDDSMPGDDDQGDDDDGGDDLPEWIVIPAGNMTVEIRTDPYFMRITGPGDRELLGTPESAGAGGFNLSPMPFLPHAFKVGDSGDFWYYAKKVTGYAPIGADTYVSILAEDADTGMFEAEITLVFHSFGLNHLVFSASAAADEEVKYHSGAYRLDADEHFFGLGLQYDSIDSRGKLRNMFLGLGVDLTDQIQNHAPIPFYISSRGYGLFVEDQGRGYFDMGRTNATAYGYKYRTDVLRTHVFYGPDPLDIIESYTALTGRPPMNPDYMFGHLHWRNNNESEAEVYADADALREHGIPTSAILVDAPWQRSYSTFEFNQCPTGCQFVDAQAVIDYCHQKGYAFYLWTAEFVNRVSPVEVPGMIEDNSEQYHYARSRGYLVPIFGIIYEIPWWHDSGGMVNFLNPEAYAWYQGLARNVVQMGVQGFKMDGGEYIGADTLGLLPLGAFDLGGWGDPETAHFFYRWMYHQLFWDLAREVNGELGIATVRTAVWGEQTHVSYFWPGDLESNWGFDLGLPADIVGGLTLGTAGFSYYGSNNGGFSGYEACEDPLLLARWTAASAFRPIFEGPRGGTQEVWERCPPQTEQIYRRYAVLHTRLFPYMKAYARQAVRTGHPIMRMLPLHYMDDPRTYERDFDYLLGEWLLVAPVYLEGEFTREVYLPAGRWVQYWTGEVHDGPVDVIEVAPEGEIPVFARAGAIVPLLDPSVQTLWPTDDPEVVDHLDAADRMWADLYPYGQSSFVLDDGTVFALAQDAGGFTLGVSGAPLARTYSLRAVPATFDAGAPASVDGPSGTLTEYASYAQWDAADAGWFFNGDTGDLWIRDACASGAFRANY